MSRSSRCAPRCKNTSLKMRHTAAERMESAFRVSEGLEEARGFEKHLRHGSGDRTSETIDYEEWCGGPRALAPCVNEIIRVDKVLTGFEREFRRTGQGYNYGNSLRGCQIYCIRRHFPHETPEECTSTAATFKRAVKTRPYLWKTDLRQVLKEKCGNL